ncbi:MAG: glycine cleavage T C-terminal barrel domain-containing protein, partial [Dehalococcoidia bacterium]
QVGDEPNVRGAHRRVEPGMQARAQNVWPSLRVDLKSVNQALGRFLPAGFYYKTFMAPRTLLPVYQRTLRRFAPGGTVSREPSRAYFDQRYAHPDVLVVGAGPAGMGAAIAAAAAGAKVLLVEEDYELGGHLRWNDGGGAVLRELRDAVAAADIEVMTNSVVTGRYDDNWIAIGQRNLPQVQERLIKARAKMLVVAPGLIERPYVFDGNDKPGVMLSGAVRRLINLYAVKPGTRAVVLTANADGDAAIDDLERVGVQVARVVDARRGGDVVRARGRGGVREVELADGTRVEADLLVTAIGWTAPTALLNMAGAVPSYDPRAARFLPSEAPPSVLATGGLVGDGTVEQLLAHGRAIGAEAARRAGVRARRVREGNPNVAAADEGGANALPIPVPALPIEAHPALFRATTDGLVDYSEDISSKDISAAVREGYDSIELAKRYTTATMGPAQGKLELVNTIAIHAQAAGRSMEETGTTTWRPPYAPISLGALAGRPLHPVSVSPMQPWHDRRGARPLIAGQWIRPDHYGDAAAEVRNVRENVGIIDVTPLGKFDLRGPDVAKLLNLLYVNKWAKLAVGAVRYGVMCANDGVILDDGVSGRLAEDRYILTTTSSGPETVGRWIEQWLQTEHPEWRVHVIPATNTYASINVAGPKSRELMRRVVEGIDLDPEAFPYMRVRAGRVAGVDDCFMWRIGFTGELSYEIHAPAAYGLYLWETLLAVGGDLGIGPFGIEAQRIMRLEKGHLLVTQDTDALTQGFGAGLGGLIKLDKAEFVGKPELVWQQARDDYLHLVGLQPVDGSIVPDEGSQIVEGGNQIVGRITSSRMSPTLGRSICLGFVAPHLTAPGTIVTVQLPNGRRVPITVMEHHAHFDPEGVRLRA